MYTYSLKNVGFGIWLLQSRNIWEGDKNGIRGRKAEKLEVEGKSYVDFSPFVLPSLPPARTHPISLLSSEPPAWEPWHSQR